MSDAETIALRQAMDPDWPALWQIIEPIFRAGETYALDPDIQESTARHLWLEAPSATFIAESEHGDALGTYYIKPNQGGGGAHVCNCGYIVSPQAQGMGVATRMCLHSQDEARQLGFHAMQYNLVVASNEGAVRLWQKLGFPIVGTLPDAFRHPRFGLVDAHVMYKRL
ncbi:GNAT family N-acetyltransferase [Aidingimonas lacisalsi]|uniref:GNAT family N-acetyltransferase n=1 Tax=Aidingimonas lacisalsi TaxID=2604086 RepID=UPI0011D2C617|nr:GNAT family N-acetyltransferase [Aidingimonas lacisalsi]